jgi:hypothetical protein
MNLFSLREIYRICPQDCGPGPPTLAHGSTDFIKRRSLATGLMAQIKPSEPLSWLLISVVHHRSDGWLWPGAAWARAHGGVSRPSAAAHWSSSFLEPRWSASNEVCSYGITVMRGTWLCQRSPTMVRQLSRCLVTVRAASGEALAPRTCAEASSSSLLASRPTNCSERRQKTQIWWLPRVRWVLDLWPKICTTGDTIYRGF